MTRSILSDAFGHHVWATVRVLDACASLREQQLTTPIAGTYGSILDTARHIVAADAWYLFVLTGGRVRRIDEETERTMELADLRSTIEGHGAAWASVVAEDRDPDADIVARRDDGSESHAPAAIRLAQALHHGTDHRSQICTGLTLLGNEPPEIDVWAYGWEDGERVFESAAAPSP
jgi:uncharacterized damage-inducible protein DinB